MNEVLGVSSVNIKLSFKNALRVIFIELKMILYVSSISCSEPFARCKSNFYLVRLQFFISYLFIHFGLDFHNLGWRLKLV